MKYDVFISYSRKDFDEVSSLIETIRTEIPDLSAWFDVTGIESGDEFEDKIISAIDNSSYVLFALSENSLASQWTKDEVMYARNTDKKVIPILLKGAQLKGWFLFKFGRIDCIDSTDDIQMKKLMRDLSRWRGLSLRNVRGESGSLNDIKESKVIVDATGTGYSNGMLRVKGIEYPMVYVAGGSFMMGSDDIDAFSGQKPAHPVTLSSYSIGKYEVTQELWEAVMGNNPSDFKGARKPVQNVSWDDCQVFIRKLNSLTGQTFRLPTEAQWEFAARGGNSSSGYKHSGSNYIDNVAWYDDNSGSSTHNVGTKSPNELGIYDMSGNIWEWCSDWYGSYGSSSVYDPVGPSGGSHRVLRGGGWFNDAGSCRVSTRCSNAPGSRFSSLGLRLCL